MAINFKNIPSDLRVPLFYAEVDNSQANTGQQNARALIIGQMQSSGTATPGVPVLSQGVAADASAFGSQSMAFLMIQAYRLNDNFGELWVLPLSDDSGAVAATGSIAFAGTATANGTLSLYIGGQRVQTAVTSGMTAAQVATAVAAAITAAPNMPVSASASASTVTLTAINKGPGGNEIDLRLNYLGTAGGEATPAGITPTITAMTNGATAPSLTTPLANLGDVAYDFIAFPYTDTASLDAMKSFLGDTSGRWSWDEQVYGGAFSAYRGTASALTTFGVTRNDQHMSIMGFYDSPTPAWIWAAAYTAQAAVSVRADAAQPIRAVPLLGVLAPPQQSQFPLSTRNTLLWDGISTFDVASDGTVMIGKAITTYQLNSQGQADDSYLDVETLYNLAYNLRALASVITSKYARVKLAADGTRFGPGTNTVTPSVIKADIIAQYQQLEAQGLAQNSKAFAQGLIVEQNATNPNRVDVLWPGILMDRLDVFALLAQFRLS